MKKGTILLFCTVLITVFTINSLCANITVDGNIKAYEWSDAEFDTFSQSTADSNCNIRYGFINYMYLPESRNIYIALSGYEDTINDETLAGVVIRINGEDDICLCNDGTADYNTNLYQVEHAWDHPNENDIKYEIRIGLKENGYEDINMEFCLIDSNGEYSNFYTYTLYYPAEETTTTAQRTTKPKTTKAKKVRTTKPKTTKYKTTKPKTTKYKTTEKITDEDNAYIPANATVMIDSTPRKSNSSKEKYIVMGAAAIFIVGSGAVLVTLLSKNDKKKK